MESKEKFKITIKDAVPEDVDGIQDVFYKTWLATYPNKEYGITVDDIEDRYKDRHSSEKIQKRKDDLENLPLNEKLLVAKDGGLVIGVCRLIKQDIKNNIKNKLQAIYVLPEYQGIGLGRKLWEEGKKFFDPQKDTVVEVVIYNKNAIDFYSKLGFQDTGRRFKSEAFKLKSGAVFPEMEMVIKARK